MIVTEEDLKPYRNDRGLLSVKTIRRDNLFSFPDEDFDLGWGKGNPHNGVLLLAFTGLVPPLRSGRQWNALQHQHGGYACSQIRMLATKLTPQPDVLNTLRKIALEGDGAENGHFSQTDLLASRLVSYSSALNGIGLDCECSWRHLSESLYPIDGTQNNLRAIAQDAIELDEIADWSSASFLQARYNPDIAIFYLVENSD